MKKFREQTFLKIQKDKLDIFIEAALGKGKPFEIRKLKYIQPMSVDTDRINGEKRRLVYFKRRDIIQKLAK